MTNQAKHTPGPWTIVDFGRDTSIRGGIVTVAIVSRLYQIDAKDADANAALIASAPDLLAERDRLRAVNAELLAALEILATSTAYYFRDFQHLHPSIAEPLNNARSAIAKAEGAQS